MSLEIEIDEWFKSEVLPHAGTLASWLRARYPMLADVDNMVQDCLVRVYRTRASGPVPAPKALLFTVARNLALDAVRRQKIVSFEPITEELPSFVFTDGIDVVETVSKQQEIELLTEAIRTLPERCRQVVTLRTAYGLSQREIAARLGISENTVERQMSKGIRRCSEFFERLRRH
jgi:RNA polymerase sigma-70 factor (ECF subfamily)